MKTGFAVASLLLAAVASTALADDAQKRAKAEGEKPTASPGWAVIEEDWWYPLRHDFLDSLHRARVHYRKREE